MSSFGISISALNAAQAGLAATSNNIANASTPGYSRESIVQTTAPAQNTGSGYFGEGVSVTTVVRNYNQFLNTQLNQTQSQSSSLSTQYGLAQQVSSLLGGTSDSLGQSLQNYFTSVNAVANAPESVAARQTMIGSAQTLADSFQSTSQDLNQIRSGLNGQISSSVSLINSYATEIASLNSQITLAQATSPTQPPNSLLDQRDALVSQLSQQIGVSTVNESDGAMDVFIGNGQSLVLGTQTTTLQTVASNTDPSALDVAYSDNGTAVPLQQSALQGGNLGGYLSFRQNMLDPAIDSLGVIATGIATTMNQQQEQGMNLNGALGTALFTTAAPSVQASSSNAGTATITATISNAGALDGHDYSVQFDGTNYNVYDTTTNSLVQTITPAQMTAGQVVTGTGVTLQLTGGAATAGDNFLVRPTVNAAADFALTTSDPSQIAAASPVVSNAPSSNLGSGTISAATVSGGLPLNANLQQTVTITFNNPPTTFNVTGTGTGNPVNVPYTPGAAISYNGWTTQISGTPSAGDTFTVAQNTNASMDGSNALLMAGLETTNTLENGTTSYQGAYSQLIGQVGTQTNQLSVTSQAQASQLTAVTAQQQAVSGVNLDEEAANLLMYQQAYQAAGKAMQVADTLFDTILSLK